MVDSTTLLSTNLLLDKFLGHINTLAADHEPVHQHAGCPGLWTDSPLSGLDTTQVILDRPNRSVHFITPINEPDDVHEQLAGHLACHDAPARTVHVHRDPQPVLLQRCEFPAHDLHITLGGHPRAVLARVITVRVNS